LKTLYPPQAKHVERLVKGLQEHGAVIDTSETGVGKTICSISCAKACGAKNLVVVCPKAIIPQWQNELKEAEVNGTVVNWEKLRAGNTGLVSFHKGVFTWNEDIDFVIFDEAQRAKSPTAKNALMVRDAANIPGVKIMLLSASLANSPLEMRAVFHTLKMCAWKSFYPYIRKYLSCAKGRWGELEFQGGDAELDAMKAAIYGRHKGSNITREELKDFFSDNEIITEPLDFGDEGEIKKLYEAMEAELLTLEESREKDRPSPMVVQLRARQAVELLKVPFIVDYTKDMLAEKKQVVIFVNFRATLTALCAKIGTQCAIYGEQPASWRQKCIEDFQSGAEKVIVVMTSAGGVGLSLHDTVGNAPRVSLVSPSWDEKEIIQALGRCHRAGGKSFTLQRILVASGTVEEKVAKGLTTKTARVNYLNDAKDFLNEPEQGVSHITTKPMETKEEPKLEHAERAHSKHSPSSLATKIACPGFENDQTRDKSAADRGSLGHEMVEKENFEMAPDDGELTQAALNCYQFLQRFNLPGTVHHKEIKVHI
jgi:superfamily II DNA or RNA helicase